MWNNETMCTLNLNLNPPPPPQIEISTQRYSKKPQCHPRPLRGLDVIVNIFKMTMYLLCKISKVLGVVLV